MRRWIDRSTLKGVDKDKSFVNCNLLVAGDSLFFTKECAISSTELMPYLRIPLSNDSMIYFRENPSSMMLECPGMFKVVIRMDNADECSDLMELLGVIQVITGKCNHLRHVKLPDIEARVTECKCHGRLLPIIPMLYSLFAYSHHFFLSICLKKVI